MEPTIPKEFLALLQMGEKYMRERADRENRVEFKANLTVEEVGEIANLLKKMREK